MAHDYASPGEPVRVERYNDDDAECHSCGKIGRPRRLIHFAHLCQHFVCLCDDCWESFKTLIGRME